MRCSVARLLLACLLAVLLPLKGMAAVSMIGCGPLHHGSTPTVSGVAALEHPHHVDHGGPVPHAAAHDHAVAGHHEHAVKTSTYPTTDHDAEAAPHLQHVADVDASTGQAGGPHAHSHAQSGCNACSPCCVSAALTGSAPADAVAPASIADFPLSVSLHASALPGRLDRPPRPVLV